MSSTYVTTRPFPEHLASRVGDLVPPFCRSIRIAYDDPREGLATVTAHHSEINRVHRAIRVAKREHETRNVK